MTCFLDRTEVFFFSWPYSISLLRWFFVERIFMGGGEARIYDTSCLEKKSKFLMNS